MKINSLRQVNFDVIFISSTKQWNSFDQCLVDLKDIATKDTTCSFVNIVDTILKSFSFCICIQADHGHDADQNVGGSCPSTPTPCLGIPLMEIRGRRLPAL